ncbi:Methyltransferase type 11 [Methylobacterium sp. 4-46]|uniref:class I SAM-dependent methyltransferase n=1 Tax=unclassified Methylobacterium TaxID=2615210 RepID=UPI000152C7F5|nr:MULTISPECIES: class I SAM-dependent methyltransferase [Methylobacterium]ACA16167.1 Methyltransferase type 11 [Methylobacterium sp. 4-46]WFT81876.1 methyltransferase domain-containing protein [Methylobacterium nodulans]
MELSGEAAAWLDRLAAGEVPPSVALMHLAAGAPGPEAVEAALAAAAGPADAEARGRLAAARDLWRANPQAWGIVREVLGGVDHGEELEGARAVAALAAAFDRAARASPEGSVALYALGSPALLRAATEEIVAALDAWGLLSREARLVDLGCGIGRVAAALAPRVAAVTGLDIAPAMIAAARERCAGLANVALHLGSGRDLAPVPTGGADLVLAVDSFPYLVQAGLAADHVREAARVLRPGGDLVVLNYSYRGDLARDRREAAALAASHGFRLIRAGTAPFTTWDGRAFQLRRL